MKSLQISPLMEEARNRLATAQNHFDHADAAFIDAAIAELSSAKQYMNAAICTEKEALIKKHFPEEALSLMV